MLKFLLILGLIIIVSGALFIYKKTSMSTASEIKTFSCPDMTDFTFQYPLFKDWEIVSPSTEKQPSTSEALPAYDPCIILLKNSATQVQGQITVLPYPPQKVPKAVTTKNNPNGVPYIYTKATNPLPDKAVVDHPPAHYGYVTFFQDGSRYAAVSLWGLSEGNGFPADPFFAQIIESFQVAK